MKDLAIKIQNPKSHPLISGYAQLLSGEERKTFILEISKHNLFLAANTVVKCAKDAELYEYLIDQASQAGNQAKAQKNVAVDAILCLLVLQKYILATELIFIEDENTENFKNENLAELKEWESETVNADVMSIFIGISPNYEIALQFFEAIPKLGIQAAIACFGNLMAKSSAYTTRLQWYDKLKEENLTPTVYTYGHLMSASPNYTTALHWYKKLKEENLTPTVYTYADLISKVSHLKDAKQRNTTAKKYYEQAIQKQMKFDIYTYKFMIIYSLSYSEAYSYFVTMEKTGIKADKEVLELLLAQAKNHKEKQKVKTLMQERGFLPKELPKNVLEILKELDKRKK
jgi:hypothetical protein